jgi:hypothetical protein
MDGQRKKPHAWKKMSVEIRCHPVLVAVLKA